MNYVNLVLASSMLLAGCVGADDDHLSTTESAIWHGSAEHNSLFPWVVVVNGSAECHGALIASRWVLTSYGCADTGVSSVTVSFSRIDPVTLQSWFGTQNSTVIHRNPDQNLALIQLPAAFAPNPWLEPVPLSFRATRLDEVGVVASIRDEGASLPPGMRSVQRAPIIRFSYPYFSARADGTSVCPRDIGSGFVTKIGGADILTGIVTGMDLACDVPGQEFYMADLHPYLSWIRSMAGLTGGTYQAAPADYDHDGKTDIAAKYASGDWRIDLAANGFGAWDLSYAGYGDATTRPVPADYDGDLKADLSVKGTDGTWMINYSYNGLAGGWDDIFTDYGYADAIPVPGDYDNDDRADLAIKNSSGEWNIDYSSNGFGTFDAYLWGFGNATSRPAPGDYDGDGATDPAIKNSAGQFRIDYSSVYGFGTIDAIFVGYGGTASTPAPADYDNDQITDLSVRDISVGFGTWRIDYSTVNGFGLWNSERSGYGTGGVLVAADYDGDGSADWSITGDGTWFIDHAASAYDGWNEILPIVY